MTVCLETCKDVRLSHDAFWRIVDDARQATRQDVSWRLLGASIVEWNFFANGRANRFGDDGPITATVTRD